MQTADRAAESARNLDEEDRRRVLHVLALPDRTTNPTSRERREARADRYGQSKKTVRVVTNYGIDSQIDGVYVCLPAGE